MQNPPPLQIRAMKEKDLTAADRLFRMALGTFLQLPDPMDFSGDAAVVRCRYEAYPETALVALRGDELVGSNFISQWGSFGLFGPLTVNPTRWNEGIGKALLDETMARFETLDVTQKGIFTFGHSPVHVELYRRYGYYPQQLNLILGKELAAATDAAPVALFSRLEPSQKASVLAEAKWLTDKLFPGLDLSREIEVLDQHDWGETVLLWEKDRFTGFAVCHAGAGTEAGSGILYVKFGAAADGEEFAKLVTACESLAASRGLSKVWTGVNTARVGAYDTLAHRGYRIRISGVAMQTPNQPGFNRPDCFVMDDWR